MAEGSLKQAFNYDLNWLLLIRNKGLIGSRIKRSVSLWLTAGSVEQVEEVLGVESIQPEILEHVFSVSQRVLGLQLFNFGSLALSRCSAIPARPFPGLLSKEDVLL